VPANDLIRERIEAFNQARGGGIALHKAGRGYSLVSQRTGARWPGSSQPGTPTCAGTPVERSTLGHLTVAQKAAFDREHRNG